MADYLLEAARKYAHEALAFERILQTRIERIDVDWKPPLAPKKIESILVRRENFPTVDAKPSGDAAQEGCGRAFRDRARLGLARGQRLVAPNRFAVRPPIAVERPARQLLSRIPLALTKMNE